MSSQRILLLWCKLCYLCKLCCAKHHFHLPPHIYTVYLILVNMSTPPAERMGECEFFVGSRVFRWMHFARCEKKNDESYEHEIITLYCSLRSKIGRSIVSDKCVAWTAVVSLYSSWCKGIFWRLYGHLHFNIHSSYNMWMLCRVSVLAFAILGAVSG